MSNPIVNDKLADLWDKDAYIGHLPVEMQKTIKEEWAKINSPKPQEAK